MATNANEIPIAEPVIIAVVDVSSLPPINNTEDKDGFSCGVPPNASRPVQAVSLSQYSTASICFIR